MQSPPAEWWRTWFGPGYLALYDAFLSGRTPLEIDQLESLLHLRPPLRVLDLPCGQGRHSIELARRGYDVTGVDLSEAMLAVAHERAMAASAKVRFLAGDMRQPLPGEHFDLVLNLYTSFGYFADEADDARVAVAAATMLAPGGRFVLEVINGERLMANFQEREWFTVGDATVLERRTLDRRTRQMAVERTVNQNGEEDTDVHVVRLYGRAEIRAVLASAGFEAIELFGDWDGSPPTADALRILAVAAQ
jgi:SAM-dependent methyltransferase